MVIRSKVSFVTKDGKWTLPLLAIGGKNPKGRFWKLPAREAVILIQTGLWGFYVVVGDEIIDLAVIQPSNGKLRLTTTAGEAPLYNLPEYPICHRLDLAGNNANEGNFVTRKPKIQVDFGLPAGELAT